MKKVWLAVILAVLFILSVFLIWNNSSDTADFLHPSLKYAIWSFVIGLLVSISLPMGALSGLIFKPGPRTTAACTAFGAGALIAALSLEIIAPTIFEIIGKIASPTGMSHEKRHSAYTLAALLIGCMTGGFLFFSLDEAINNQGKIFKKAGKVIGVLKKDTVNFEMERADAKQLTVAEEGRRDHEHGSTPMALWLGALIDGIPEGFIIGSGFLSLLSIKLAAAEKPAFEDVLPYTLIAGLFLSNFPEALSATMGMKKKDFPLKKIMRLWISLVFIISLSSLLGYFVGAEIPHEIEIGIEGLAAGAMLTMVAQTMLPEAVHVGGHKIVGLSTLIGYLCTAAFKILE